MMQSTMQNNKVTAKLFAILVSFALVMGLTPAFQLQEAWADDATVSVTCRVVGMDASGADQVWAKSQTFTVKEGSKASELSQQAFKEAGLKVDASEGQYGWYLSSITDPNDATRSLAYDAESGKYWQLFVNGKASEMGAGSVSLAEGDSVVWYYSAYGTEMSKVKDPVPADISVTCRVVGMDASGADQVWAKSQTFTVKEGSKASELSQQAFKEAGLKVDASEGQYGWYLSSITDPNDATRSLAYDAESGKYWQLFVNGKASEVGAGSVSLAEGDSVVWYYSAYGTEMSKVKDPIADNTTSTKGAYTADKASTLISNLTARFIKGGADATISNETVWAAFGLHAQGKGASIDTDAVLKSMNQAKASNSSFSAGTMAKYILILNAAGVDCTKVADGDTTRNLIKEMLELMGDPSEVNVWSAVCILPAIDQAGKGTVSSKDVDSIVAAIVAAQDGETGLFGGYGSFDAQTTSQAILALLPHSKTDVLKKAQEGLLKMQLNDGGFVYSATAAGLMELSAAEVKSDPDTTANVVAALAAMGTDPSKVTSKSGSSPLDYLVSVADADMKGFEAATSATEPMTAATALMGLTANQGYQKSEKAFDAYVDVIAGMDPNTNTNNANNNSNANANNTNTNANANAAGNTNANNTNTNTNKTSSSTTSTSAKTADNALPYGAGAGVLALGAVATLMIANRRKSSESEKNQ